MKKAKRLLAVLLAALMLFTAASIPSYAYISGDNWHTPKDTADQKYYFDYAQGASWLLDMLDDILFSTGLCLNCDELNDLVDIGINIFTSNIMLNTDQYLEDAGCVDESGQGALDIRSVDNLIKSVYGILDCLNNNWVSSAAKAIGVLGDILDSDKGLQMTGLDPTKTRNNGVTSDKEVLEMLIYWISNQRHMLKAILNGTFGWGSLLPGLLEDMLTDALPVPLAFTDDNTLNIGQFLKDLLYNLLVDSTATAAPTDGSTVDDWLQQLIDMAVITGTGETAADGGFSLLGANAEPLMPAVGKFEGGASLTGQSFYKLVNNVINGLFGGTLKDLLSDLLYDMLDIEVTEEYPMGNPQVLQDTTYNLIIGIVQGLFEDNGAPKLTLTGDATQYPVPQMDALLDWLLVGDPANNIDSALDTFILIDYYGIHIQDNFMSLLNDVARLLINLLPSLGLFSSSAHLAYEPDELTVSWYADENYSLVASTEETAVTPTYLTFETGEVVYPTEYVTDANGAEHPSAYCYLDDKSAVNTTDASNTATYRDPSLIRPNYVITTKMVFANIIKLALNDFIEGCYFPEWTTDIPSVLAYGLAAMAAPVVPENNYYARLDAYHAMLEGEVAPIDGKVMTVNGDEVEVLPYAVSKVITIKDINGNATTTANVEIPRAALDIIASFGAKRLNGVFHFNNDSDRLTTDTTAERFLAEFLMWAANQYMPAFVGTPITNANGSVTFTGTNAASTNAPIWASAMTTLANSVYSDYTNKVVKETANWDAVYDLIDSTLFKLLPTSWLPNLNGSSQFINQWLLGNLINFDLQGILGLFQVNEDPNAELNNSALKVIINILDRVLSLVFNDNAVLITSGQTSGRQGAVMNNNVTTMSTLAELIDCSSETSSLPMLIDNLLTLLNRYKTPLLGTALPLLVGSSYIKHYDTQFFDDNDLKTYKVVDLENYLDSLYDHTNAYCVKEFDNIEDAEASVDGTAMAIKNADGIRTDILLSTGAIFGTYDSRDEANNMLKVLKDAYVHEEVIDEENEVFQYHVYANESYMTSAKATLKSDDAGDYNEYTDFTHASLTYRTVANPLVSYDDDYRFFQYEDFGKSGYLYNNHKSARDAGYEYIDTYTSFAENDLVNAYGEWLMFDIESQLKANDLYDKNGDGRSVLSDTDTDYVAQTTDSNGNVTDEGYPVDGEPSIPNAMYPFLASSGQSLTYYNVDNYTLSNYNSRQGTGMVSAETGEIITGYTTASFTAANFEQIQLALDYAAETDEEGKKIHNVILDDEDTESVVRLWLGTIAFDITKNGDGLYDGSIQWDNMTEAQLQTITTKAAQGGYTVEEVTLEDGTTTYQIGRPAFALFSDNGSTFSYNGVSRTPVMSQTTILGYQDKAISGDQTYAEEIAIAIHNGYYEYADALHSNRVRLLSEIDEISWRLEKAEDGRTTTADTTVLKWLLDLTFEDYKNPQTRKRNVIFVQDEKGNNIEAKAYTTTSYTAFRDAYDYAEDLYDAASDANILAVGITQSMITKAYQGLLEAWQGLVEFTGFADWTQIDGYVAIAEEILNDPYLNDPDFGVASGLAELETALKDAYAYTDNLDNPDTSYDLNKNSKGSYDSESQLDIDSAAALLNQAIQSLVYNKVPSVLQNPEQEEVVKIQNTKYENQIQEAHIYGLQEGVGLGDGELGIDAVLEMLGLKVSGMTVDGKTGTVSRTNATHGSGTDARIDGRYQTFLRFRYFAVIYGDINGDTRVDGTDAAALKLRIAKNENNASTMGSAQFEAADVTHDGGVDNEDVQAIINHYTLVQDGAIDQNTHSPIPEA